MSVTNLVFYEADDSAVSDTLTFSAVSPGTPTAAQQLRLWNGKDDATAETGREILISALAKGPGDTDYNMEALLAAWRCVEVRITGSEGTGIVDQVTGWIPVGSNRWLDVTEMPGDTVRDVEVRLNVPPGLGSAFDIDVTLNLDWAKPARATANGISEVYGDGVHVGLGDGTHSFIVSGGTCTQSGSPDANVNFTDIVWVHEGVHKVKLAHAFAINGNDVNAAALAAGEAYWSTLYLDENSTVQNQKGAKATSPLSADTRPAVPAGGILLAYVQRDFDAAIANADIFQTTVYRGYFSLTSSGLVITLGPGRATVDNTVIRFDQSQTMTLDPSLTNSVWLTPDGALDFTTDGARPDTEPRALLLYECTTDGSSVTATKDKRRWIGGRIVPIVCQFISEVNNNDFSLFAHYPSSRPAYLLPVAPVLADIDDDGTSAASGSWKFDVFKSVNGAAEATIFTNSGTVDRRPVIAYNDTTLRDTDAVPEVVVVEAYSRFRAKLVAEPGSITVGPAGARVTLLAVEV